MAVSGSKYVVETITKLYRFPCNNQEHSQTNGKYDYSKSVKTEMMDYNKHVYENVEQTVKKKVQ